jgi:hypothetical protein
MLSNILGFFRVLYIQTIDFFHCNKNLNYFEELENTVTHFNSLKDGKKSRLTHDIGTLFRSANKNSDNYFSIDNLNGIIKFDAENKWIEVGGKTRYYDILKYTLKYNLMPKVVPELSSITVGGAITGISIESSSFKYGWGHDSVIDIDVLTASGEVLFCTENNENKDLFNTIPNSYGTMGYITRAKIELIEAKPYVKLINYKFNDSKSAFEFLNMSVNNKDVDFIDAVAYNSFDIHVILGFMCDINDTCISQYPKHGVYYKSIKQLRYDCLTIYDYIWRWDADMFWGVTDVPILENKWFRRIFGRCLLNTRVLRSLQKIFIGCKSNKKSFPKEKIIQDLGVPVENSIEFFNFICTHIDKYPIWICPVVPKKTDTPLWNFNQNKIYYDIGVFTRKKVNNNQFYYNRLLERKLLELNGNKCFYSDTYFTREEFDKVIDPNKYKLMKEKYDPQNQFGDLYEKVVTLI